MEDEAYIIVCKASWWPLRMVIYITPYSRRIQQPGARCLFIQYLNVLGCSVSREWVLVICVVSIYNSEKTVYII